MQKLNEVKEHLGSQFGTSKITIQGDLLKLHVKKITTFNVVVLALLIEDLGCLVDLKRSGTGITILVTI